MRSIYQDIAERTAGDIYIGVVGPARTGKSTFIKRFMESLVLPSIPDGQRRARARDELPQSGSGRTVMTAEPKFVPEAAVELALEGGGTCAVRLIDCVGYLVPGAVGQYEDDQPRMVRTPWSADEMPMAEAAELGTRRVIAEHSTIGIVVTTDGTITDLPREAYVDAERRVIEELKALGKPFLILVNSARPESEGAQALRDALAQEHGVTCLAVSCLELGQRAVEDVIRSVLYEFPVGEVALWLPAWVDALEADSPLRAAVLEAIRGAMDSLHKIRDVAPAVAQIGTCPLLSEAQVTGLDLGTGRCTARLDLPRSLFYETLSARTGLAVGDDGALVRLLTELGAQKREYERVAAAMREVRATGYGVVLPEADELTLEEPELLRQGGRYGVRLRATAPSIHLLRADLQAEVAPIVGSEQQSEDLLAHLARDLADAPERVWALDVFGRSCHELMNEDLAAKLAHLPEDARQKLRQTLERILNEGSGGLICIIL